MGVKSRLRRFAVAAIVLMASTMQAAGCSEVKISGKTARDVFRNPQTLMLVEAACSGDLAKMDALVRQGADVNATGYRDMTPLFWTMACRNYGGVEKLLELGADPNYKMEDGASVMWGAAGSSDPHFLPLMLTHGGDPNIRDGYRNALMIAIEQGQIENVKLLLDHGADVNEHDEGGGTAAIMASYRGNLDMVQVLLEHGYSYDLRSLAVAVNNEEASGNLLLKKQDILALLKERGVKFPLPAPRSRILPPPRGIK